jgi:hypothetical protein
MKPLFNSEGEVVAWQHEDGRLMDRHGGNAFWTDEEGNVFDFDNKYRGVWQDGHWRGLDGGVVVFREDANIPGLELPLTEPAPPDPMPEPEPQRHPDAWPGDRPVFAPEWSSYQPFK